MSAAGASEAGVCPLGQGWRGDEGRDGEWWGEVGEVDRGRKEVGRGGERRGGLDRGGGCGQGWAGKTYNNKWDEH